MAPIRRPAGKSSKEKNKEGTRFAVRGSMSLMDFLMTQMQGKSKTSLKQLLSGGHFKLNGQTVTNFSQPVKSGDVVVMEKNKKKVIALPASLKVVYEDAHLMVVNKDAGLLTMSTSKENRHTAYAYVSEYLKQHHPDNRVFIVHRLDRETSGLMMFAKSAKIQETLQKNWNEAVLCRRYYALVEGFVEKETDTIHAWIQENSKSLKMYVCKPGEGFEAITHYRIVDGSRHFTLLDVTLDTGRKNQIRVHLQHVGHPIAGDVKYGARHNPMKRLGLHAAELSFVHPVTRESMHFSTAIPPAFLKAMQEE